VKNSVKSFKFRPQFKIHLMNIDTKFVLLILFRLGKDVAEVKDEIANRAKEREQTKSYHSICSSVWLV